MMKMEKARRFIEVVVKGSLHNGCIRHTVIAGLLLAESATAALAFVTPSSTPNQVAVRVGVRQLF